MKKLFKFMSIALLSSFVLVACGEDETDDQNNNETPLPTAELTINWGGQAQTIKHTDPFHFSNTVYYVIAAKDYTEESYEFPLFRVGLDLDSDPEAGCALTAQYAYTDDNIAGDKLFPTDVVETQYYDSQNDRILGMVGDWQLDIYTVGDVDLAIRNAQFDPNAATLTGSLSVQMFSYTDIIPAIEAEYETPDEEALAISNAITAARKKYFAVTFNNLKFSEEKSVKTVYNKVK